jgi:hypothetical protein
MEKKMEATSVFFMCSLTIERERKIVVITFFYPSSSEMKRLAENYTALQRHNTECKYSQKRNCAPQSQFLHSCFYERFIYCIPTVGMPILLQEKKVDRFWEYIHIWLTDT